MNDPRVDLRVTEDFLDRLERATKEVLAKVLKRAQVKKVYKLTPSKSESISMVVCAAEERVCNASCRPAPLDPRTCGRQGA